MNGNIIDELNIVELNKTKFMYINVLNMWKHRLITSLGFNGVCVCVLSIAKHYIRVSSTHKTFRNVTSLTHVIQPGKIDDCVYIYITQRTGSWHARLTKSDWKSFFLPIITLRCKTKIKSVACLYCNVLRGIINAAYNVRMNF